MSAAGSRSAVRLPRRRRRSASPRRSVAGPGPFRGCCAAGRASAGSARSARRGAGCRRRGCPHVLAVHRGPRPPSAPVRRPRPGRCVCRPPTCRRPRGSGSVPGLLCIGLCSSPACRFPAGRACPRGRSGTRGLRSARWPAPRTRAAAAMPGGRSTGCIPRSGARGRIAGFRGSARGPAGGTRRASLVRRPKVRPAGIRTEGRFVSWATIF